jgi:hypothetical protein
MVFDVLNRGVGVVHEKSIRRGSENREQRFGVGLAQHDCMIEALAAANPAVQFVER